MSLSVIFVIVIVIMSVVIHEVSHGFAADMLGDPTARYAGRLTLNPLSHLDFFGSFLVPLLTYNLGGFVFGWAKPVPYNPYNLRNQKWGDAIVAVAGPLSNILLALFFGLVIRFGTQFGVLNNSFIQISSFLVLINIGLAIFNLVPVPPLDGSKILFSLLPLRFRNIQIFLEQYGIFLLLIFIFFLWQFLSPVVGLLFKLFTGMSL
ncbi:MAG: site-2 protease family protein [Candidatus Paceibacterota bacterium]